MSGVHDSIVRRQLLSEKEQTAKDRLFKKKGPGGAKNGTQELPDAIVRTVRKQPPDQALDREIEGFMKEMTAEVKKMNMGKLV